MLFFSIALMLKMETHYVQASADQSTVDTRIFDLMGYLLFPAIELIGTIILMSQIAWPVFVIFIPVTAASLWYMVSFLIFFI